MWRLSEIQFKNIVSFHEASYVFNQNVATLIFGRNEDNTSQPCNGSGKSSLIEAIALALTGEPLRKVKSVEEIINDSSEEAYDFIRLENDYNGTSFTIERTISRNAPQIIECHKYDSTGVEIEMDKTIQPTVLDYNKFILSELGLTKDDIYNNFILCDNKYESFFDCSDKNKKEVINRFCNGIIVDESIAKLQKDMEPVAERLSAANNNVISIKGSISAIEHELEQVDDKITNARQDRQRNIERLDEKIQECFETIETDKSKRTKAQERLRTLQRLQSKVLDIEKSDIAMLDAYHQIKSICDEYDLGSISDFESLSVTYKTKLAEQNQLIANFEKQRSEAESELSECKKKYASFSESYQKHSDEDAHLRDEESLLKAKIQKDIDAIEDRLDKIEVSINDNKKRQAELEARIANNTALLSGVIVCPNCKHQFILGNETSVEDIRKDLTELQNEVSTKKSEIVQLNKQFDTEDANAEAKIEEIKLVNVKAKERETALETEYNTLRTLSRDVTAAENKVVSLNRQQNSAETEVDRISGKIEVLRNRLFGEITGILEGRVMNGQQYIDQQTSSIQFTEGQLKQYQQSKKELVEAPETDFAASLKSSLEKYLSDLSAAENDANEIKAEYDTLKGQEVHFTMFKSYIARKKIDALSLIVNDFLEKIGSDIRLKLEGFSVTKTEKLRDKISVQVMRDGIDCGSYYKFSGGEKARLNLACILALHTLTNSNCEDGKGLDFIIIDELLDKSDEVGMATYCEALNKLKQTALLITQGGVSESYPHKLLIVKKHGVSTITN